MNSIIKKVKVRKGGPDFYNCPDAFSFKDLLAILFTMGFFYACYRALSQTQALELVKSITYLIAIVLGGYFGQEITASIIQERYKNNHYHSSNYSSADEMSESQAGVSEDNSEAQV